MSSVTRIYNRCLKTANSPEDCAVTHVWDGVVCVCACACTFLACSGAFEGAEMKEIFFFKKNKEDSLIKQRTKKF